MTIDGTRSQAAAATAEPPVRVAGGAVAAAVGAPAGELLRAEDLSVSFHTRRGVVRAVDGVTFSVSAGRTLGIVGESGSGKTVLSRAALGLLPPAANVRLGGRVSFGGVDLNSLGRSELRRLRGQRVGLVSQNPMVALNPVVRIGRQITEGLRRNLGFGTAEARARALDLLDQVGIPDARQRMTEYPHQLSGGLRQRVAIAIAISCEPELLVADEPTTALDVTVQAQILALLQSLQRDRNMAMIFISHDLAVVAGLADEIAVMYAGRIVEQAPALDLFASPRMPYTAALLAATPRIGDARARLSSIEGRPPDMVEPPPGCRFHPRCTLASERCRSVAPALELGGPGHSYACWHPLEPAPADLGGKEETDGR
jgi:oligopeptide/dipeptide ABC transporter ATP-binding protein